jgi:hypothetical protein
LTNPLLPHVLKIQPRRRKCRSSRPPTALKKLSYLLPYFSLALSAGEPVPPSPLDAPAEGLIKKYKSQGQKGKRGEKSPFPRKLGPTTSPSFARGCQATGLNSLPLPSAELSPSHCHRIDVLPEGE